MCLLFSFKLAVATISLLNSCKIFTYLNKDSTNNSSVIIGILNSNSTNNLNFYIKKNILWGY